MLNYILERRRIKYCEEIIKTNSYTFYKAFSKITNKSKREAVYVVYAFCRYADDLIDEHQDTKGLIQLQTELTYFVSGKSPKHDIFKSLKVIKKMYPESYDYKPFFDMIHGQFLDLEKHRYETLDELLGYCYYVASSVGYMLLPILAPDNYHALENFALKLGYAMQITNILRDIGEDYLQGRIYIPQALLKKHNVSIEEEMTKGPSKNFIKVFEELETVARDFYNEALEDIDLFSKDVKGPLLYAAILYRAILDKIKENQYQVFHQKNFLTDKEKMKVIESFLEE
jgi:phytoene synthase